MLHAITSFCLRRPLLVVVLWLALVGAGFAVGGLVFERLVGDVGTVVGSESDRAEELMAGATPEPERLTAVVTGVAATDPALRVAVDSASAEVRAMPGVADVSPPLPSAETGEALLVRVTLAPSDGVSGTAERAAERLHQIEPGTVTVAGGPLTDAEFGNQAQSDVVRAELVTTPVVLLLLLDLRLSPGDARLLPTSTQTRQQYDALVKHYPAQLGPAPIVIAVAEATDSPRLAALRDRIAAVPGVKSVAVGQPGPVTVLRAYTDEADAEAATRTIRDLSAPFDVAVAGRAASLVDYRAMLSDRLPWAAALVVLGTLVLLFLFTGSVLLPVKAVVTSLLSIGAALGAVVWVFQQGNLGAENLGGTNLTIPVLVGAITFGLSVDYEVFLLSRMRERLLAGAEPRAAVAEGLQQTGGIVTSAAQLIVVVFAGFLLGGFVPIRAIGLGLVLAVALDATVVRMLLVPATMTLLGRYSWWAPHPLRCLHTRIAGRFAEATP